MVLEGVVGGLQAATGAVYTGAGVPANSCLSGDRLGDSPVDTLGDWLGVGDSLVDTASTGVRAATSRRRASRRAMAEWVCWGFGDSSQLGEFCAYAFGGALAEAVRRRSPFGLGGLWCLV